LNQAFPATAKLRVWLLPILMSKFFYFFLAISFLGVIIVPTGAKDERYNLQRNHDGLPTVSLFFAPAVQVSTWAGCRYERGGVMARKVKVLRKGLEDFRGDAWLVSIARPAKLGYCNIKTRYYVVSGVVAFGTGWEVLIFPADKNGKVERYIEVCGGRGSGYTHEDAIEDLSNAKINRKG
jgi:hypothetical protein